MRGPTGIPPKKDTPIIVPIIILSPKQVVHSLMARLSPRAMRRIFPLQSTRPFSSLKMNLNLEAEFFPTLTVLGHQSLNDDPNFDTVLFEYRNVFG